MMVGLEGLGRRGEGNGTGTGRTGYGWEYDCGRQLCGRVARGRELSRQLCWARVREDNLWLRGRGRVIGRGGDGWPRDTTGRRAGTGCG